VEIAMALVGVVLVALTVLVVARRRRPEGDGETSAGADTSVLHCAAPPPQRSRR
jgi:hypothetical protein